MTTYVVQKAFGTWQPNQEVDIEPVDAAGLVSQGVLTEKSAPSSEDDKLRTSMLGLATEVFTEALDTVAKDFNVRAKAAGRLTIPARQPAEPAEERSLGEWLQCMAFAASPSMTAKYKWGVDRLVGKYHSQPAQNFEQKWNETSKSSDMLEKASKGFQGDAVSKASAQIETQGSLGGFTVPVEFFPEMIKLVGERSVLFARVRKYPMTSLQMNIPALDYSKGGSGASPYLGGMVAAWGAEGQSFSQTNASFRQVELKANLLQGYTVASRTLLADNQVALQTVLTDLFSETIAYYIDFAILNGTGVNQPKSIGDDAGIAVTTAGTAAGNLLTDFAAMDASLMPDSEAQAIWLAPPSFKKILYPMTDASGRVVFLPNITDQAPTAKQPRMAVFGKSLFFSQLPVTSGSTKDLWLIDCSQYAWGMRQEIEVAVSEHVNFLSNQLTWRFLCRGDGQNRLNTKLTLQNGDTVSNAVYRSQT